MSRYAGRPAAPHPRLRFGVCAVVLAAAPPVWSQEAQAPPDQTAPRTEDAGSNVTPYKPAFFTEFRPNTAFDMIVRIPGFSFDGGSFARGFAGTAGNVLIDGERPPSRDDSLSSVLSRIPASGVERIDVIRGGAEGIDMQGKSIIANVIRKPDAGRTGAVSAGGNMNTRGDGNINGQAQMQDQRGGRLIEGSLSGGQGTGTGDSFRQRVDPSGAIILEATSQQNNEFANVSATGAFETTLFGGKFRINGKADLFDGNFGSDEAFVIPAGGSQVSDVEEKEQSGELGVRYTRDISGFGVEVVAFQSLEHGESSNIFNSFGTANPFTSGGLSIEDRGESIASATVRLPQIGRITVETGAEAVYNWTESEDARILDGQIFPLVGDAFQADEMRAEAFGRLTWKPTDSLNAELGARYEWSRISADVSSLKSEKTLSYFKPRLNLSWSPGEGHQFNLSVERLVDQLSFGAFASSASFENEVFGVGNADIEPEKHWVYEGRYERQFGGQNSFVAKVGHRVTEDVLGRVIILVPSAPGLPPTEPREITQNLDEATRTFLDLSGNFELDRFGMKGGIVNLSGSVRNSETVDPVTGETRRVSGDTPYSWNFSLQQTLDNGNFRWALFVEDDDDFYNFSPRSYGKQAQLMFIGANITWKPVPGWTFGAGINNILKSGNRGWSVFYDAGRDVGNPLYLQRNEFEGATNFFVNLRKNF
jgi:hypothetical protein